MGLGPYVACKVKITEGFVGIWSGSLDFRGDICIKQIAL